MTLSGKVSLKVKMTILIIEILIIGSYGVVVGDKNMGAIRNDAIASMEEYVSEEHPEYSQEEIQQELQPILQKMQQEKKAKQDQFFYFMVIMCILTDIWVLYLTFDITSGVKRSALFAKKMGQGDFTQRVEEKYLKREDEIGILARSIRDIHHNMRHLIGYVQREADTLDDGWNSRDGTGKTCGRDRQCIRYHAGTCSRKSGDRSSCTGSEYDVRRD